MTLPTNSRAPREPDPRYDQATRVPDPSAWFHAWREGSERARQRTPELRTDVSYGGTECERLDLYLPNHRPRNLPFAVFVNGNTWPMAKRLDAGYPALAVHGNGAALVVVGYDREADLETRARQVSRAWAFLVEQGAQFGLDPSRGHLLGHATGALIAALAAFDPHAPAWPRSAVLLSGLYDMQPLCGTAQGDALGVDAGNAARLSPLRGIPRGGPDLAVAWGDAELDALRRQSADFARAARGRGLRTRHGELPGRNHYDTSLELANRHSELLAALRG